MLSLFPTIIFAILAGADLRPVEGSTDPTQPGARDLPPPSLPNPMARPNVLVIMTDDQDKLLNSHLAMPETTEQIGQHGLTYNRHYCTVAWCCPSRVNFFTGKAAHNTNVTSIAPPFGGWQKFVKQGLNEDWLPVWLQDAGIDTYYVGKLMNGYNAKNFDTVHPKGWTKSNFLVDPFTYYYHNATFAVDDSTELQNFLGIHTTVATRIRSMDLLIQATSSDRPFFMMVAPVAPHLQDQQAGTIAPPSPPGFANKFAAEIVPRTENFNPEEPSGASWVHALNRLPRSKIDFGDEIHRARLRNIAGVDEMVGFLIDTLRDTGKLDNTYVVYTTDNGFHIGNHRMHPGKKCGYEEDINIPLLIRGPGVPANVSVENTVSSHTDLAPTILKMFGLDYENPKYQFDGEPIVYREDDMQTATKRGYASVEFWDSNNKLAPGATGHNHDSDGQDDNDGDLQPKYSMMGNTYKALRMQTADYNFYYSVWCNNEHEFYDMDTDSQQMHNLHLNTTKQSKSSYFGRSSQNLFSRLDALLMVLKSCTGDSCRNPYKTLFPQGQVTDLPTTMQEEYDNFFASQPKVTFTDCGKGYIKAMEGPQDVRPWVMHPSLSTTHRTATTTSTTHPKITTTTTTMTKTTTTTKDVTVHPASTASKSGLPGSCNA